MKERAELVSRKRDMVTWCRPGKGYRERKVLIETDEYEEIATVAGELPESDENWPLGAPIRNTFKIGNRIVQKTKA